MSDHEVGHDGVEGPLPLAAGPRTRARVGPPLARVLVLLLLQVPQHDVAAAGGVLARELDRGRHL